MKKRIYACLTAAVLSAVLYIGAKCQSFVRRVEDAVFYRGVQFAEDTFGDPAGLEIMTRINGNSKREVYLAHPSTGRRIYLGRGLMLVYPSEQCSDFDNSEIEDRFFSDMNESLDSILHEYSEIENREKESMGRISRM